MLRTTILFAFLSISFLGCTQDNPAKAPPKTEASTTNPQETSPEEPVRSQTGTIESDKTESAPAGLQVQADQKNQSGAALCDEAKALFKAERYQDGYKKANEAMRQLEIEQDDLAWIILETIEVDDKRIDVHFNMGERERKLPDTGIVRPLSFRVWSNTDELMQVLDFEIGRFGGETSSAAIGEATEEGHVNHGVMELDSDYAAIRKRVIDQIAGK